MIDFHVHMGNLFREGYPQRPPLTVHQLVDWMDRAGIGVGVNEPDPQIEWFRTLQAPPEILDAIGDGNARRLLRLDPRL